MNLQIITQRLERHTERLNEGKIWLKFEPKTKDRKVKLTEEAVLDYINKQMAVTSNDIAEHFGVTNAPSFMIRLTRRGKVLQVGVMSEKHRKQFPFPWGWMYAPVGHPEYVNQVLSKRTDLIPGELQLLRNMADEYSRRGKFLPTPILRESHGWTANDVSYRSKQAMKTWSDLHDLVINENLFI